MIGRRALLLAGAGLAWPPFASAAERVPPLRLWQARRICYGYAAQQQRPGYRVVRVERVSPSRCAVRGEEPGYLCGTVDCEPDLTVTLVERRRFQFWIRDPFTEGWVRWL